MFQTYFELPWSLMMHVLRLPSPWRKAHHLHSIRASGAMYHLDLPPGSDLKYVDARVPYKLTQPAVRGVPVHPGVPEQRNRKRVGLHW